MTLGEFKYIADSLVGVTKYIYFHILGEPLTHPELSEMIKYATDKGYKCAVTTNGTLFDKVGCELLDCGVYKINVSLHSFEELDTEAFLSYLDSCLDFADKSSQSGILTILRMWNVGYDEGRNEIAINRIKEKFPCEWALGKRGARIRDKLHIEHGDRFEWPTLEAENRGDRVFCYGLRDQFGILCDGSVVPCCLDSEGSITLGNIFDSDIRDILTSDRAVRMKECFDKRIASEELCKRCGYARRFDK